MARIDDPAYLRHEQYRTPGNLQARIDFHVRFRTNPEDWQLWVFDRLRLPPAARILEIGCGAGTLWLENRSRIPAGWEVTLSDLSAGMLAQARRSLHTSRLAARVRGDPTCPAARGPDLCRDRRPRPVPGADRPGPAVRSRARALGGPGSGFVPPGNRGRTARPLVPGGGAPPLRRHPSHHRGG